MSVKLQTYSVELKTQAVRMAVEDGLGIKETATRLSIPSVTLAGWVAKLSKAPNAAIGRRSGSSGCGAKTFRKRKQPIAMECEILKKTAAYFARESLQGTLK